MLSDCAKCKAKCKASAGSVGAPELYEWVSKKNENENPKEVGQTGPKRGAKVA